VLLNSLANIFWFFANFSGRLSAISRARRKWPCDRRLWLQVAGTRTQTVRGTAGKPWKNRAQLGTRTRPVGQTCGFASVALPTRPKTYGGAAAPPYLVGCQVGPGRISLEEFRSPNPPLGYKMQIPHCPFSMRYLCFLTPFSLIQEKWAYSLQINGDGQIWREALSRKQNDGSTIRGESQPARLEN
jgi:hypothetical protein